MIRHITGKYLFYEKGSIVVETQGGIGFRIHVADTSPVLNAREGDVVQLYTYMQVKDDGMSLFGFNDRDALTLFEQLLTVNGVGLADKVSAVPIQDAEIAAESAVLFSDERNNAVVALTTLGYSKAEAEEAIGHVPEDDLTIEEYIKKSLKFLM